MKSYSQDLRGRIVEARRNGGTAAEVAKRFGVCKRTVERYWKRFGETGQCNELRRGGYRVSRLKEHLEVLRKWIEEQNDITLAEIVARLRSELAVRIKRQALWHQLNKLGLTYKKNASRRRAKPARHQRGTGKVAGNPAAFAGKKTGLHR